MSVIVKYLKESRLSLFFIIFLLILKVVTDLALPLFTSQIVDVGLQQGGIEKPLPMALSEPTYKAIEELLDADNSALLNASYRYNAEQKGYFLKEEPPIDEQVVVNALAEIRLGPGAKMEEQAAFQQIRDEYAKMGISIAKLQNSYILKTGLKMIGVSAVGALSSIAVAFFASRVAAKLGKRLRKEVFHKVVSFSQSEMDNFSTASLVTRSTNDIQQIQQSFVMILRVVVFAPLMAAGGIVRALTTNVGMSWIIGLAVAIIFTIVISMLALAMSRFKKLQILIDNTNRIVRETLSGLSVIRAFNNQAHERSRFEKANEELTKTSLFVNRVMSAMMPLMTLVMNLTAVLIVWRGGAAIEAGAMQLGDMMAFIQYSMMIIMSFLMITMLSIMLPRASVSANRIKEVLNTPNRLISPAVAAQLPPKANGEILFDNVSFAYQEASSEALSSISFKARTGTTTAIIGSTGSGKSTILNLIPRFHDVTKGRILIDGIDVREYEVKALRHLIGYVPQRGLLFSGTIESNIAFGDDSVSKEDVEWASEIAQARPFIEERVEKFQSPISQGGTNVSGGQRQRLSIARALARHPQILLFDDSFSALDYRTEQLVRQRLTKELSHSTVIIVAQRISTILHADNILVLDEGQLVGQGKHQELLESCQVYQEIAESQLSKQELINHG